MFRGSMVAVVTPMRADGALDFEALARLVEFHIENGTDAIICRRHHRRIGDARF
jgi:4-hydroxy-tetrahydrodipicolinate synthase